MVESKAVKCDEWLGSRFAMPVYRLDCSNLGRGTSDWDLLISLMAKPGFIYTKLSVEDVLTCERVGQLGFRLIETSLQFNKSILKTTDSQSGIRFAKSTDRVAIRKIASESFKFTRFHSDDRISRTLADKIKADWAEGFFSGERGEHLVVAEVEGQQIGFLQLLVRATTLIIDLIAVSQEHQGKGIAKAMIRFAENNIDDIGEIKVGTQVTNIPSVRMYESIGFKLCRADYVYHYILSECEFSLAQTEKA